MDNGSAGGILLDRSLERSLESGETHPCWPPCAMLRPSHLIQEAIHQKQLNMSKLSEPGVGAGAVTIHGMQVL